MKYLMLNFTGIPPLGTAPIHAKGQTNIPKLIDAFHDYPKASKRPVAHRDMKLLVIVTAESLFTRTHTLRFF
jgi:hypothetical protein